MAKDKIVASGVQELINRLKDDGVKAGQDEAQRIINEAQEKAANLVAQARAEAEELMAATRAKIEVEKDAANESLKIAIRDTELMLESRLKARFADHVKHLVTMELEDHEFLKQLILTVAGSSCSGIPENKDLNLLVAGDKFDHLVSGLSETVLRKGIEIKPSETHNAGIRICMKDEDVEIDLSGKAITEILLKYLLPKYGRYLRTESKTSSN